MEFEGFAFYVIRVSYESLILSFNMGIEMYKVNIFMIGSEGKEFINM